MKRVYLDYNASSPIAPEVAMRPFLTDFYGNPSTSHWAGKPAKETFERARQQVADLLGCNPDEVIFTSGGTESANHALKGVFYALKGRGNHIITTQSCAYFRSTVNHKVKMAEKSNDEERRGAFYDVCFFDYIDSSGNLPIPWF